MMSVGQRSGHDGSCPRMPSGPGDPARRALRSASGRLGISPDVATVTPAGRRAHATAFAGGATGLAKKQAHARDTQVLLHMAQAWLLVAELAQLHREDGPSDGQKKPS